MNDSERYGGDLTSREAWDMLASTIAAELIDVRTTAEWTYVGRPDLGPLGREPLFVEWQRFPEMTVDPRFVERLSAALEARGTKRDDPLLFICRSGGRSRAAARAMTAAGFTRSYNVADGFEGPPDEHGHRGVLAGWKAADLPWRQS